MQGACLRTQDIRYIDWSVTSFVKSENYKGDKCLNNLRLFCRVGSICNVHVLSAWNKEVVYFYNFEVW